MNDQLQECMICYENTECKNYNSHCKCRSLVCKSCYDEMINVYKCYRCIICRKEDVKEDNTTANENVTLTYRMYGLNMNILRMMCGMGEIAFSN